MWHNAKHVFGADEVSEVCTVVLFHNYQRVIKLIEKYRYNFTLKQDSSVPTHLPKAYTQAGYSWSNHCVLGIIVFRTL